MLTNDQLDDIFEEATFRGDAYMAEQCLKVYDGNDVIRAELEASMPIYPHNPRDFSDDPSTDYPYLPDTQ